MAGKVTVVSIISITTTVITGNEQRQTHTINQSMDPLYKSQDIILSHDSEKRKVLVQSVAATYWEI